MAAGIVSFGAAALVVSAIKHLGGYTPLPLPARALPPRPPSAAHLVLTMEGILTLYGANFAGLSSGVAVAIALVHLAGLALALWGFCRAFRRFFSASDLIVPVLATGIVINLAAYTFSIVPVTWFDTREIPAVLPFGAVLAGRLLAEPLARAAAACCRCWRACWPATCSPSDTEPRSPRGRRRRASGRRLARGPPP